MKILLVCSSGGHFIELYSIKKIWEKHQCIWITFPQQDTFYFLQNEKVYWAYYPTNRNIYNFIRNFFLAVMLFRKEKPGIILSTGAGVSVPFIYLGKLLGKTTIYLESLTRFKNISLSGKLVMPVVDHFLVQWPELAKKYPKALYKGQII